MLEKLNTNVLSAHLHTNFKVQVEGSDPVTLELIEVAETSSSPQFEQFSAFFLGPNARWLGQGIHRLEHDKLGSFDLFLVPVGADEGGTRYEAAFARYRDNQT